MAQRDPVAQAWAQRVVAWHNRHPLARRISAADLSAPGHVQLPFSDDRKRHLFSERLLPRLSAGRIARLARRDGSAVAPADRLPQRLVAADPRRVRGQAVQPLWLATVALGSGRSATRVLIGSRSVLGLRLWSRPRLALVTGALLVAAWLPQLPDLAGMHADGLPPVVVAHALTGVAGGSDAAAPVTDVPDAAAGSGAAADAATDPAAHASDAETEPAAIDDAHADAATAAPPVTGEAAVAESADAAMPRAAPAPQTFPPQRPQLDAATKAAAREAVARARATRAVAAGTVYALAMPRVRTRAESELLADALRSAAAAADAPPGWHVDVLPAGDDWRAVGWPFVRAEDAERLRDRIAARGLRIELIAF